MNSNTVDLIATDPPFNKSRDFHATPDRLNKKDRPMFQDRWSWERDVHEAWTDQLSNQYREVLEAIESARYAHSDSMGAYMCFMAVRLLEMKRILKPTGSIYLHCDPTASHYLKAIMDAIFGWKNFKNEIVWCYKSGGASKNHFARKHDIILFYAKKTKHALFNPVKVKSYGQTGGGQGGAVKYYKDTQGSYSMVWARDWWEISMLSTTHGKRTGYPTQKPPKLYERIIKASSNKGDIVLDPFCGCATTCVASEKLGRQWIGIDIWKGSHQLVLDGIKRQGLSQEGEDSFTLFSENFHYRTDIPERTDEGEVAGEKFDALWVAPKEAWQKLNNREMKEKLVEWQRDDEERNVVCAGCGRILEKEFMELDHIQPKSGYGTNFIDNRILLCRPCNGKKSDRFAMKGLWDKNKQDTWMRNEARAKKAGEQARRGVANFKREMSKPNV